MARTVRILLVWSLMAAGVAWAQEWKGKATVSGKVTDPAGKAIGGAVVTMTFGESNVGPDAVKTKNNGEWEIKNLAEGKWTVRVAKEGFDPQVSTMEIGPQSKSPHIQVRLAPIGSGEANAELIAGDKKARALMADNKFAEARAIYEELLAKYPKAVNIHVALAQAYDGEGEYLKAAQELRKYLQTDPQNVQMGVSLALEYAKAGKADEAFKLMKAVPPGFFKSSVELRECGFSLLRLMQPADALKFFDMAIVLFPKDPTNYYYRGVSEWQIGAVLETPGTPQSRAHFDRAIIDLNKFLSMAPRAIEAEKAKEILEMIK